MSNWQLHLWLWWWETHFVRNLFFHYLHLLISKILLFTNIKWSDIWDCSYFSNATFLDIHDNKLLRFNVPLRGTYRLPVLSLRNVQLRNHCHYSIEFSPIAGYYHHAMKGMKNVLRCTMKNKNLIIDYNEKR